MWKCPCTWMSINFFLLEVASSAAHQPNMITPTAQHPSQIMADSRRPAYGGDFKQKPQCQSIIQWGALKGQKLKSFWKVHSFSEPHIVKLVVMMTGTRSNLFCQHAAFTRQVTSEGKKLLLFISLVFYDREPSLLCSLSPHLPLAILLNSSSKYLITSWKMLRQYRYTELKVWLSRMTLSPSSTSLLRGSYRLFNKQILSSKFLSSNGSPQGCVLSPLLFVLYTNDETGERSWPIPKISVSETKGVRSFPLLRPLPPLPLHRMS